ncbi:hypothetical protein BpHYR1_015315 [Brachionus plicatilis]|uniref:Uncharacterized protein n=1 Tax=Brachionus plicatilis TaxID=10195 RepID=A0A3M7QDB8_BRAPC|nr:hypothetical protein BpHYR1_015315 [Brachionus plicatilis]
MGFVLMIYTGEYLVLIKKILQQVLVRQLFTTRMVHKKASTYFLKAVDTQQGHIVQRLPLQDIPIQQNIQNTSTSVSTPVVYNKNGSVEWSFSSPKKMIILVLKPVLIMEPFFDTITTKKRTKKLNNQRFTSEQPLNTPVVYNKNGSLKTPSL